MQSSTSLARSGAFPAVLNTAPSACTTTDASGERSNTLPPPLSKRWRTVSSNTCGFTPTLSTSVSQTSSPPTKPTRIGLNSMPTTSSSSPAVSTPSRTSSCSSLREAFQSCARPRSSPASITATVKPRKSRAHASRMPRLPPHTTTSNDSRLLGAAAAKSSVTIRRGGGGGAVDVRMRSHASSSFRSAASVPSPPALPDVGSGGMVRSIRSVIGCGTPSSAQQATRPPRKLRDETQRSELKEVGTRVQLGTRR
mmetsp:Transcript_48619/g.105408  ORF Transcript_48619/g.105408 Transcript_48619/m.105408 type:complete len:253 (-) Transcript_48619:419-1177(-)